MSRGDEDIHLSGDPDITLWKSVYVPHTNFAIESIENKKFPVDSSESKLGKTHSILIDKNADLLSKMYLQIELPSLSDTETYIQDPTVINHLASAASAADGVSYNRASTEGFNLMWVNSIGNRLIEKTELYIGGQLVDEQYGLWMEIWDELTNPHSSEMIGKYETDYYCMTQSQEDKIIHVPLQFWFCRHRECALSMFHSDIVLRLSFASFSECVTIRSALGNKLSCKESSFTGTPAEIVFWDTTENAVGYRLYASQSSASTAAAASFSSSVADASSVDAAGKYFIRTTNLYTVLCDTFSLTTTNILSGRNKEPSNFDFLLFNDYVYLDEEERLLLSKKNILIEQLQTIAPISLEQGENNISLNEIRHNVKELFWILTDSVGPASNILNNDNFDFSSHLNTTEDANNCISLNNEDCTAPRSSKYFSQMQAYDHHTNVPVKEIYCFNFSIYPENFQPSGNCYFTDIKQKHLRLDVTSVPSDQEFVSNGYAVAAADSGTASVLELSIFALNYNKIYI